MPYYAIGNIRPTVIDGSVTNIMPVEQVKYVVLESELNIPQDREILVVDSLITPDNPNSIVGRTLNVNNRNAPVLLDITLADQHPAWLERVGAAYTRGMDNARQWWPNEFTSAAEQNRAQDVLTLELPNWWRTNAGILAQAITARAWNTMTAEQIETVVHHYESLLTLELSATSTLPRAIGIIKRWYDIGRSDSVSTNSPNPRGGSRNVNNYGTPATYTLGYTDTFQVVSGVLSPRTPDYQWLTLASFVAFPPNFDPENPS